MSDRRTQRAYRDMLTICYQEMCDRAGDERSAVTDLLHCTATGTMSDPLGVQYTLTDDVSGEVLATSWLRVPAELFGEAS